ncbi:unnamed protein product [Didymodactylos carnosus]|uniref:Uncharacterized protein n=1 Tax=Didymodactylos carnosus TaxID=1234261 RepID=A0A814NQT5_9BILA|nr:unnamed protein product [Didymodactylos carnosus]CAF3861859.1 unnamed protein product [Didymodactylos carnosus]
MSFKTDKKYGKILEDNIQAGAKIKFDLESILSQNEMSMFNRYKEVGANADILFFALLPLLSHFAQSSTYVSMFKQLKALNLYSIVIGPPVPLLFRKMVAYWLSYYIGCGKSPNIKHLMTAAIKVTKIFKHDYIKSMPPSGDNIQLRNSVTNGPYGLSLLKLLSAGDVCLINDEIDGVFVKWGIYNEKPTEEISLLCASFDSIHGLSRATSLTAEINGAKLSILGGTTGTHLATVLKHWSNRNGQDGLFSRMIFLPVWYQVATRPNDLEFNLDHVAIPSFIHVFIVCHLLKSVEYHFDTTDESQIFETGRTTRNATVDRNSAYYYVFNKVADQSDMLLNQQFKDLPRHIASFYAKVNDIYPRICVLLKLYKNIITVLNELKSIIDFDDDFGENDTKTQKFIAATVIVLNQLFLSTSTQSTKSSMPVLYIDKTTCQEAWKYYLFIFNSIKSVFNIDTIIAESNTGRNQTFITTTYCKTILTYPYTFFSTSMITGYDRHDLKVCGPFRRHAERFHECVQALIHDGLLYKDRFLVNCEIAYHKVPPPIVCTRMSYEEIEMEMKLKKWGLTLAEYRNIHQKSSSIKKLTDVASKFMLRHYEKYYRDFPKYINNQCVRQDVDSLIQDDLLEEEIINGQLIFTLKMSSKDAAKNNSLQTSFCSNDNQSSATEEITITLNTQSSKPTHSTILLHQRLINSPSGQSITATQESISNVTITQAPVSNVTISLSEQVLDSSSENNNTILQSSPTQSRNPLSLSESNQPNPLQQEQSTIESLVSCPLLVVKEEDDFAVADETNDKVNGGEELLTPTIRPSDRQQKEYNYSIILLSNQHNKNAQLSHAENSIDQSNDCQLIDLTNDQIMFVDQPATTVNVEEQTLITEILNNNEQALQKGWVDNNKVRNVLNREKKKRKRKGKTNHISF